ncbi:MAG: serine/threonine-protein kinase, partial [Lachnospiraceae bacterium]|nr:serine/threonine-protein kinase [Lachnospiraceae bacterium]
MNIYDIKCKIIEEELKSVWPDWHAACRLGSGSFGDVFQIYRDNFGIRVDAALKVIQVDNGTADYASTVVLPLNRQDSLNPGDSGQTSIVDSLRNEIQIMEALYGAPNIVVIEDYYFKQDDSASSVFVRMELLTSLQDVLKGQSEQHTLSSIREIRKFGRDICTALMYCEKKGIIHRDIKPSNLFLDSFGNYKVGDFGSSRHMDTLQTTQSMTGIGTFSYMAPEVFRGRSYNNTVDIYSLGLVMYQLLNNGRMPFLPASRSYTAQDLDCANNRRLHGTSLPE